MRVSRAVSHKSNYHPIPSPLTDAGNAAMVADDNHGQIHYLFSARKWLIWDGCRWVRDDTGEIYRLVKRTLDRFLNRASKIKEEDRKKRLLHYALKCQGKYRIEAMISLAAAEPGISVTEIELDSDPYLLNTLNGTIDLKTGKLRPHRPEDLITRVVQVNYDPLAECHLWNRFLEAIMDGNLEKVRFLQKAIGYSLTGDVSEQVMFMFYGTGANGKSTFIETIQALLGEYALSTPTETLLIKNTSGVPSDVARLKGARFVSAAEAEPGKHLAEALVKRITGGDTISARHLYGQWFDFRATFKFFLSVNHKPTIQGNDNAIWRRIVLIPFTVTIPPEKRDRMLLEKLKGEFPGILRWAVEGCLMWQSEGLNPPESIKSAGDEYRKEMDVIGDFLSECCEEAPEAKTPFKDLYHTYTEWCEREELECLNDQEFARGLTERGFHSGKKHSGRVRIGIRLKAGDSETGVTSFLESPYK